MFAKYFSPRNKHTLTSKHFHVVPKLKTYRHPRIDMKKHHMLVVLRLTRSRPIPAAPLLLGLKTRPKIEFSGGGAVSCTAPAVRLRPFSGIGAVVVVVRGEVVEGVRLVMRVAGRFTCARVLLLLRGGCGGGAVGGHRCRCGRGRRRWSRLCHRRFVSDLHHSFVRGYGRGLQPRNWGFLVDIHQNRINSCVCVYVCYLQDGNWTLL